MRHHETMTFSGRTIPSRLRNGPEEELSALPLWAFTLGIFGLLTFGLTALPSIICGHLALSRTCKTGTTSLARSVAIVGLVIGYVGAAVFGTWLVVMLRLAL